MTDVPMANTGDNTELPATHKGSESHNSCSDDLLMLRTSSEDAPVQENGYESECSSSSRSEAEVAYSALEIEADTFTRFIERQRMDVMFELRRLRLGERPVTGQPNRERIETFLNNRQERQQGTRVPSTRPAVPSAHSADIDALANRRCVSAALTSAAFRQDLENTIRQSVGIRSTPSAVAQAARPSPSPAPVIAEQARPQVAPVIAVQQPRVEVPLNLER